MSEEMTIETIRLPLEIDRAIPRLVEYDNCPVCATLLAIRDEVSRCPKCGTGLVAIITSDGTKWHNIGRLPENYGVYAQTAEEACGIVWSVIT